MMVILVVYKFRGEIKVLLYFKLGWRPFDRADDADVLDKVDKQMHCVAYPTWF